MAEILFLNPSMSTLTVITSEIRRRIRCALYMADRWCFSAGLGLPCLTKGPIETEGLPMDDPTFWALKADQTSLPEPPKPGLWAHMITLVDLFGPIQDLNRRTAQGGVDSADLDRSVAHLAQQLVLWEERLPPDAKMSTPNVQKHQQQGTGGPFFALHFGYHHYSTLLYFRFLEDKHYSADIYKEYAVRCKYHASSLSSLLRLARSRRGCESVFPTIGHMAAVSSSVLLHTLLFGDEDELGPARDDLQSNFEALIDLKQYWPSVSSRVIIVNTTTNLALD